MRNETWTVTSGYQLFPNSRWAPDVVAVQWGINQGGDDVTFPVRFFLLPVVKIEDETTLPSTIAGFKIPAGLGDEVRWTAVGYVKKDFQEHIHAV